MMRADFPTCQHPSLALVLEHLIEYYPGDLRDESTAASGARCQPAPGRMLDERTGSIGRMRVLRC